MCGFIVGFTSHLSLMVMITLKTVKLKPVAAGVWMVLRLLQNDLGNEAASSKHFTTQGSSEYTHVMTNR